METTLRTGPNGAGGPEWRSPLARVGLVAKGVLYLSLGVLATQFVLGRASSTGASRTGAVEQIARQPFGRVLLILLTVGLAALTLWNVVRAATGDPAEGSDAKHRLKFAISALVYGGLTASAVALLVANWVMASSGGGKQQRATAFLFTLPAGRLIVGALGLLCIAVGVVAIYRNTIHEQFMERLSRRQMSSRIEEAVEVAGRAGYGARGAVFAVIGALLVLAAVQRDASDAGGLSEALHSLAGSGPGVILLWVIAVGFVLYGVFAFAEARYRRTA